MAMLQVMMVPSPTSGQCPAARALAGLAHGSGRQAERHCLPAHHLHHSRSPPSPPDAPRSEGHGGTARILPGCQQALQCRTVSS